jgi:anti-sigma B factor antagonist
LSHGGVPHDAPVAGVEERGGALLVRLAGELDLYNSGVMRDALLEAAARAPERLLVELSEVEFIDSTALGVLIEARSRLADRRTFMLVAPNVETRRALEISGLDRHFAVHASVEEALAASI